MTTRVDNDVMTALEAARSRYDDAVTLCLRAERHAAQLADSLDAALKLAGALRAQVQCARQAVQALAAVEAL